MTNEEMQRTMGFIVEQQAQFATNIQQLQEQQANFAEQMQQATKRTDRLERVMKMMVRAGLRARREMREQDARITTLVDSQMRTEQIAHRNSESISQLAEIVRQLVTRQNGNGGTQNSETT